MAESGRYRALEQAGLLHAMPEAVVAEPFGSHPRFFARFDKVQVKYEMLRAHVLDGQTASAAASEHGYSRAALYLVAAAFERSGMVGLLDERPGRRGPLRVSGEVLAFLEARRREAPEASGAQLAAELETALGVRVHRRTVEKALRGR